MLNSSHLNHNIDHIVIGLTLMASGIKLYLTSRNLSQMSEDRLLTDSLFPDIFNIHVSTF